MTASLTTTAKDVAPDVVHGPIRLPLRIDNEDVIFHAWYYAFGKERWVCAQTGNTEDGAPVPLRIESACFFGHVLHSAKCDCGFQLNEAFRRIAQRKRGMVIYAVDQDARGLGMEAHFKIYYYRQQLNYDTEEVYQALGAPLDSRCYDPVARILRDRQVGRVVLLSNNLQRKAFLEEHAFEVACEAIEAPLDVHNMPTLMLEKEDLGYTWSFKTHADWLAPLQQRVVHDDEQQGVQLVRGTETVVAEWLSSDWNLAHGLASLVPNAPSNDLVVYATDFPRADELPLYARMGAQFVVVPFPVIPSWLRRAGEEAGIRIQDWGRKNRYEKPRPQWELVATDGGMHAYRRRDRVRLVPQNVNDPEGTMREVEHAYAITGRNHSTDILRSAPHARQPWLEVPTLSQDEAKRSGGPGVGLLNVGSSDANEPRFVLLSRAKAATISDVVEYAPETGGPVPPIRRVPL